MNAKKSSWRKFLNFIRHEVWHVELSNLSGMRNLATRFVRVCHLVIRGYQEDHLPVHASALTFSTLMALVPLLAIIFSVMKGLGAGEEAQQRLLAFAADMPSQFQFFVQQILSTADRTNFVALGWVGVALLFFTLAQVFGNMERSFNQVWGVSKARVFWRRLINYTSITIIVPVLLMAAFAISATFGSKLIIQKMGSAIVLYHGLLRIATWAAVWFAFFMLFICMPNTYVQRRAALWGALISAMLWIGWQKLYIHSQINLSGYNSIYGTFASVPIFLLWLYVGWAIILFGSEITFALQNHDTYHMEQMAGKASVRSKIALALSATLAAARAFESGSTKFDIQFYAQERHVPIRLINDVVAVLVKAGYLAQIAEEKSSYVLLRAAGKIYVSDLVDLFIRDGVAPQTVGLNKMDSVVETMLADLDRKVAEMGDQKTLKDLMGSTG